MTSLPQIVPSPCGTCRGPCCRGGSISLSGYDVVRLIDAFRVPWQELALAGVAFGGGFKLDPGPTRWGFRLKHRPDQSCVFAVGDEYLRCAAHAVKPAACRIYPFHVALREDGTHVALGNDAACPPAEAEGWAALAGEALVARELAEHARYGEMVERWEAQLSGKREIDEFLRFAREAM